jgi:glycosyltransferase involved in cell wall biosynthesis
MDRPDVTVVLPCYRAAALARRSTEELRAFLDATPLRWEVIVVDDGGGDFDASWPEEGQVRLIRLPTNRGKGAAVRAGMLAARGKVQLFTDVDVPYELDLIPTAAAYILERGFHVVLGDRTLPGSRYLVDLGLLRRIASRVFMVFVGRLVTGGFFDTQCGFKAFRADVAQQLFRVGVLKRFAFDVELVYVTLIHRLDVKRVPVRLRQNEGSSIRLLRDSSQMLLDVLRLKWNRSRGRYAAPALEAIPGGDFAVVRAEVGRRGRAAGAP